MTASTRGEKAPIRLSQTRWTTSAIAAFTINAAYVNSLEGQTGSIEVGKLADLIVVDRNLFAIDPTEISEARVLLTLLEGSPVHGDFSLGN